MTKEYIMRLEKQHIEQFINDIIEDVEKGIAYNYVVSAAQRSARFLAMFCKEPKLEDFAFVHDPKKTELGFLIYQYAHDNPIESLSQPAFRSAVESIFGF